MKKEEIRKALNVPKEQRIGQWIYNNFREFEVIDTETFYSGVDIFDFEDDQFLKKLLSNTDKRQIN